MKHILSLPAFRTARIIFMPESNLAFMGYFLADFIKRDSFLRMRTIIMNEDKGRPGVKIDNGIKRDMALSLAKKIEKRQIRRYADFFTKSFTKVEKITAEDMWDTLIQQLIDFSKIQKPSNDVFGEPREFYSGKMGRGYDDVAIAVEINLFAKRRFYSVGNEKYRKYIKPSANL